ncbi:HAD family hydrolase [Pedobacter nyackensis]|uniref:HAD family hydrolase n=1 Tax=Pedobacter nyackensis TaxID=475255 RepID=UPI00292D0F7A|nr:HAD hydrolase-like protein [Pedobacter nyackensis]
MNIFFDLDGTLIDSKDRLYFLFQHLVPESAYTFEEYWGYKMNRVSHKEILLSQFGYSLEAFLDFEVKWMGLIEADKWLDLDHPFDGITEYLTELSKEHDLFVVTARQSEEIAMKQIQGYGWQQIFKKVFVTGQKLEKYDLIINAVDVKSQDWFIGDTGKDIQTGKLLGINTAAVLSGFLGRDILFEYQPDIIVDNVMSLNF